MDKLIIHISGASGSGKTTLGNKLKEKYKSKIIVKDLDNLRDEFINIYYGNKSWTYIDEDEYQNHIDNFIKKQKKTIVFVGLNDNTIYGKNKKLYYNVHSQFNYYIDIDDKDILKQKCLRLLNDIQNDKGPMNDLINNNEKFIKKFTGAIKHECNLIETIKSNNKLKKDYEKQNYKFMTRDKIYKSIENILNKKFY
jgi:adenylate kinase family enzyme